MPLVGPKLAAPVCIPHLLQSGLTWAPDDLALVSATSRLTWRALETASDNLGGHYLDRGLAPGDRVASLMPNRVALIVHYLACLKAGLVAVPLNYRYSVPEIDRALSGSQASMLIVHAERERDTGLSQQIPGLPHGVVVAETNDLRRPSLQALIETDPATKNFPTVSATDPAFIFFTSGSTGPAKGVTHSRAGVGWLLATYAAVLALAPADVMLAASSISHIAGFGFSLGALATGARTIVAHSFDGAHILPLLRVQRPTVLWMQPALLSQLVENIEASPEDFRSLRHCRSGSDRVPNELTRKFAAVAGLPVSEGLGMTELGIVTGQPIPGPVKNGSIGRVAPGVRISIRDHTGRELPAGAAGRMWIDAPGMMSGYWNDRSATEIVIRDGWFDSGDIVKCDDEGYITFCGRSKHLIVRDGSNISPLEVEDALLQHPAVTMAGVVGVPDPLHGETVCAYVVLKTGVPVPTEHELIAFSRDRIGYKAPGIVLFLAAMPLSNGKIDRTALMAMATKRT